MALTLSLTATQSGDATEVTITATGNFADNGYTESQFVRQLILTDYLGTLIQTYTLPPGTDTQVYPVPENTNPWINIEFTAVGPVSVSKNLSFPANRYYQLAFMDAIKEKCGCACCGEDTMCMVDAFSTGMDYAIPIGDAVNYQDNVNAAYKLLTFE